jgi:hypothetical protein
MPRIKEDVPSRTVAMPRLIGAFAALVALVAGILARIDPVVCLQRAAIAFALGWLGGQVWHALCTVTRMPPETGTARDREPVA